VLSGRFHYGTAFGEPSGLADTVDSMSSVLVDKGFSYCGKDFLTSGLTGEMCYSSVMTCYDMLFLTSGITGEMCYFLCCNML
jgi:DNA-directed RNA polymerase beta subunit